MIAGSKGALNLAISEAMGHRHSDQSSHWSDCSMQCSDDDVAPMSIDAFNLAIPDSLNDPRSDGSPRKSDVGMEGSEVDTEPWNISVVHERHCEVVPRGD